MNDINEEEENKKKVDYSKEYAKKLKKFKPISYFLLFLLGTSIIAPIIILAIGYEGKVLKLFLAVIAIPIILSLFPVYFILKCPACDSYMGQNPGNYCPKCGAKIREEANKDEANNDNNSIQKNEIEKKD